MCVCRVREFGRFSEKSDVYSFGVFLLELVSGQEATDLLCSSRDGNIVEWVGIHSYICIVILLHICMMHDVWVYL